MIALAFVLRWSLILVSTLGVSALLGLLGVVMYILPGLPSIAELDTVKYHVPLRIYSADGKLVAEYGAKRRIPLRIEEIPDSLKQAVVAAEDANFYHHPGVDYKGLLRAVGKLITTGEKVQGGSTISGALAKSGRRRSSTLETFVKEQEALSKKWVSSRIWRVNFGGFVDVCISYCSTRDSR